VEVAKAVKAVDTTKAMDAAEAMEDERPCFFGIFWHIGFFWLFFGFFLGKFWLFFGKFWISCSLHGGT
jgi:hypothetical protein